ncbi:MAG: 3-deoxy-7-phosphoheptulonate synthase [Verrucomicrobia bacterium]|nr:3-deoxy-7-phosphoheptulonate synthase [Verrucomicrobiota bacterium]
MHLPSPKEIKHYLPLSERQRRFIERSRDTVRKLLAGKDERLALVLGPCSIHDSDSALEFAHRLKKLSDEVANDAFLVMRVYIEKPRTMLGWKGFLYDPYLDGSHDLRTGIYWSRQLLLHLAEMEVPAAMEFLEPLAAPFFSDLITWGFIGARTSYSQTHRQLASHLPMPVGFKNSVDGSIDAAIQGMMAARIPHAFFHMDEEGKLCATESTGNPDTHIVLRGSTDSPNFSPAFVQEALQKMESVGAESRILIDCSHGNSQKEHLEQKAVFDNVLFQREENPHILGMMLESHLNHGSQMLPENPSLLSFGVSITDPCLDWASTEELTKSLTINHLHK